MIPTYDFYSSYTPLWNDEKMSVWEDDGGSVGYIKQNLLLAMNSSSLGRAEMGVYKTTSASRMCVVSFY